MINGFENQIINFKIDMMLPSGEDTCTVNIKKSVKDVRKEILRVQNLPSYKGEDNSEISRINKLIDEEKHKYIKKIKNIFILIILIKVYLIRFKKRYYGFGGNGYKKLLKNWNSKVKCC